MERKSGVLDTVVIGQDDKTELHVQAAIVGGRRQVDIRIWKRGPTGFAPSRSALTVEAVDLTALQEGIAELLEASNGGQQVARVVWDKDEGRRLRAETEPFGTRYLARFGFWQRVRDTWRPADDGLVIGAEHLKRLQEILDRFRPKLSAPEPAADDADLERETLRRWPTPGADWITIENERIAFHPRGVRITAAMEEGDEQRCFVFRQWRRQDTLWLPEEADVTLALPDLDRVLVTLRKMADTSDEQASAGEQIPGSDGSTLWVRVRAMDDQQLLCLDLLKPPSTDVALGYEPRLLMPAEYLPRFGRLLAQCAAALLSRLSEEERNQLRQYTELEEPVEIAEALAGPGDAEIPGNGAHPNGAGASALERDLATVAPGHYSEDPDTDLEVEPEPEPPSPPQRAQALTDLRLGRHIVFLRFHAAEQLFYLNWDDRWLQLPLADFDQFLTNLRTLYYEALRGKRGQRFVTGGISMTVHHHGFTMYIVLEQERDGRKTELSFPAGEVPGLLNEASGALTKI